MLDEKFLSKMKNLLGEKGLSEYLEELEKPSPRALRVNTIKGTPDKITDITLKEVPYAKSCYYFDLEHIGSHPMHHAGLIYVQEPAAMMPIANIDIQSDWKILDTCSAPGGKSLQAAAFLGDEGMIVSNEINLPRAKIMTGNFERMGVKNAVITSCEVESVASLYPGYFDLVIVDAPCSGEGMFRKEAAAINDWSEQNVAMCAERQRKILSSASSAVRSGGYLVYSTCTFSIQENEDIVNDFLEKNTDFSLEEPKESICEHTLDGIGDSRMRRFYPHISKGEGQFTALLKKNGNDIREPDFKSALSDLTKDEMKCVEEFLSDTLTYFDKNKIKKFKDSIVYIPEHIKVPEKITYSCGVTLGEVRRGYFQPHHQLFSALGNLFKRQINLSQSDSDVTAYLKGESFMHDIENGWCAILIDGVMLGGGKAVNSQIKNHYPKGLRIQH